MIFISNNRIFNIRKSSKYTLLCPECIAYNRSEIMCLGELVIDDFYARNIIMPCEEIIVKVIESLCIDNEYKSGLIELINLGFIPIDKGESSLIMASYYKSRSELSID